jgi:hypothetical protein
MKIVGKNTNILLSYITFITLVGGIISLIFTITNPVSVFASTTNGTISTDQTNRYAYMESGSWIDFGGADGGITATATVKVTDTVLSGYAWSPEYGWISLNCSNENSCATVDYKVSNNGEGVLSGYSWSESAGWIDWKPANGGATGGVTIDSSGIFHGRAWGDQIGWVTFNCLADNSCATVDYKVSTDWRPRTARPQCNNSLDDDGDGKIDYPADPGCSSLDDNSEIDPVVTSSGSSGSSGSYWFSGNSGSGGGFVTTVANVASIPQKVISGVIDAVSPAVSTVIDAIIPDFLKTAPSPVAEVIPEIIIPEIAPLALDGNWNLLPAKSIGQFVLAPLPQGIRALAAKFPSFGKMLGEVGVTRLSDLEKLQGVALNLPGLTERSGINSTVVRTGTLASMVGVPLAKLSASFKQSLPSETVFARAGGELIDLNASVIVSDTGDVSQKINTESGQILRLAIKPESAATSVKGYLSFLKRNTVSKETEYPNSMLASAISALPVFGKKVASSSVAAASTAYSASSNVAASSAKSAASASPVASSQIEDKLVLLAFDYSDPDKDGIWTADVNAPVVAGEYEVMTIISYVDPQLGVRQVRLVTVVDPEGYVYEKNGTKETRIPDTIVSIFELDSTTGQFVMWPAATYHQENPQKTGVSGTYSFLVPPGKYRITAAASGYTSYEGQSFDVQVGSGVHQNIELVPNNGWLKVFDWKVILLVIVVLLLFFNFYRDYRRGGKL